MMVWSTMECTCNTMECTWSTVEYGVQWSVEYKCGIQWNVEHSEAWKTVKYNGFGNTVEKNGVWSTVECGVQWSVEYSGVWGTIQYEV